MRERASGGGMPHDRPDGARSLSFSAFDTDLYVDVYPSQRFPVEAADEALAACRRRCAYFERAFSRTRPDSDVSRAHAASPKPVAVRPETAELVEAALGFCERSGGAYDVTMGTVTSLWDFHTGCVPSRVRVAEALAHVGWRGVSVDRAASTIALADKDSVLDLGGIAKGYVADDLARMLDAAGCERFAANLGGNVLVRGGSPAGDGRPWRIGVPDPRDPARTAATVELLDGSVVTSGAYERRFARGGTVYHHILDPGTGFPVRGDVASATVVSDRSVDGDACATAAFVLGVERGLAFVEGVAGAEALLIDEAGRLHATSGLARGSRAALHSHGVCFSRVE